MKKLIQSDHAPKALGPYSQAVQHGGLVFLSGQVGIDPETGKFVEGGVEAQTHRVIQNLTAVLEAAGLDRAVARVMADNWREVLTPWVIATCSHRWNQSSGYSFEAQLVNVLAAQQGAA